MKIKDIDNNPYVNKRDWIGQGWGYKVNDWSSAELDDVVYIPEYGYEVEDNGMLRVENPYTKQDFINLADGDKTKAEDLFCGVDWQFPETLIGEGYFDL